MDWVTKNIQEMDLFKNTEGFLKQFGIDPIAVAPDLLAASQNYAFHVAKREKPPLRLRGELLKELHDLEQLAPSRRDRRLPALSEATIRSLCGIFPSSMMTFDNFGGDSSEFQVIDHPDVVVSAIKNDIAHRAAKNVPLLEKVHGEATILASIARTDLQQAKSMLALWAKEEPDSFGDHIRSAITIQERTFQLTDGSGRNVRITETVDPNPDWRLINAVLDIVWPIENGKLRQKRDALSTIIGQAKCFALTSDAAHDDVPDDANHVDADLISMALTLRHQINSLDQAIQFLEIRRARYQTSDDFSNATWKREERLDRRAFYPLVDWRRELQRRLRHGDYLPWKKTIRRATGPVYRTPEMPVFNKNMNLVRRTLMLIRAAKPTRP